MWGAGEERVWSAEKFTDVYYNNLCVSLLSEQRGQKAKKLEEIVKEKEKGQDVVHVFHCSCSGLLSLLSGHVESQDSVRGTQKGNDRQTGSDKEDQW